MVPGHGEDGGEEQQRRSANSRERHGFKVHQPHGSRADRMTKTRRGAGIGLGHWDSAYGPARGRPESQAATLVAAASADAHKLEAFPSTFRVPGYLDYRELLEREAVD